MFENLVAVLLARPLNFTLTLAVSAPTVLDRLGVALLSAIHGLDASR